MIQTKEELEIWYKEEDPWGYFSSLEDDKRKAVLLSEIPERKYKRVLDIGCGNGFITKDLPGEQIVGIDISEKAIKYAKKKFENERIKFECLSIFELNNRDLQKFDLIVITGVLYPQYIGNSNSLIYLIIDRLLSHNGVLVSVHISEWYNSYFPYLLKELYFYDYKEFLHRLEVYLK